MPNTEPTITPEHIRDLWDAGLSDDHDRGMPALYLTRDGRVVVSDRQTLHLTSTVVITAWELRNFTRGRFTVEDARDVAWALSEELRVGATAEV